MNFEDNRVENRSDLLYQQREVRTDNLYIEGENRDITEENWIDLLYQRRVARTDDLYLEKQKKVSRPYKLWQLR